MRGCGARHEWDGELATTRLPRVRRAALRPDIVWFGEMPYEMDLVAALEECDLFVSIGTSGAVYPAAGFVQRWACGARTLELNLEPSAGSHPSTRPGTGRPLASCPPGWTSCSPLSRLR